MDYKMSRPVRQVKYKLYFFSLELKLTCIYLLPIRPENHKDSVFFFNKSKSILFGREHKIYITTFLTLLTNTKLFMYMVHRILIDDKFEIKWKYEII